MPGKSHQNLEKRAKSPKKWSEKSKLVGTEKPMRRRFLSRPGLAFGPKYKKEESPMRNLKRALSLAVASVMLIGMMVSSAQIELAETSVRLELEIHLA